MATEQRRMAQMRDTQSNFDAANFTPLSGEMVVESDSGQFKVGDGTTPWETLPYKSAGIHGVVTVATTTFTPGASHCGMLVNLTNSDCTINLSVADLSQGSPPGTATGHFPYGGVFYVTVPDGSTTLLTVDTPQSGFSVDYNERGARGNTSSSRQLNNGNSCANKLYMFAYRGSGLWAVFELDTYDVWAAANNQAGASLSYGGYFTSPRGTSVSVGPGTSHIIEMSGVTVTPTENLGLSVLSSNTTITIPPGLTGPCYYRVWGGILIQSALPNVLIGCELNGAGAISLFASRQYTGTLPSSPTYLGFEGMMDLAPADSLKMRVDTTSSITLTYYDADFYVQRMDLNE